MALAWYERDLRIVSTACACIHIQTHYKVEDFKMDDKIMIMIFDLLP